MDLASVILEQLGASVPNSISVGDLLHSGLATWRQHIQQQLNELWKEGRVYVSRVEHTPNGYLPDTEGNWTIVKERGFYGYDPRWGLYLISDRALDPLTISLEATLDAGFQIHAVAVGLNKDDFVVGGKTETIRLGSLKQAAFVKQFATKSRVWSLAFSPEVEHQFISGENHGSILLWSKYSGQIHVIGEAQDRVASVRYSPDGKHLLSAHQLRVKENYPVRLWSVERPDAPAGMGYHSENVYGIGFLHDGQSIVSAGSGKVLKHYSLAEQRELYKSKVQSGTISCLAVHPQIPLVVTGSWSGKLNVYDLIRQEELDVIEAHISRVISLAISPSGHLLASGSRDSQIAIWKLPQVTLLKRFIAHNGWIRALAFADDTTLLSGGTDELCKVWHLSYAGKIPTKDEMLEELRRESEDIDE